MSGESETMEIEIRAFVGSYERNESHQSSASIHPRSTSGLEGRLRLGSSCRNPAAACPRKRIRLTFDQIYSPWLELQAIAAGQTPGGPAPPAAQNVPDRRRLIKASD